MGLFRRTERQQTAPSHPASAGEVQWLMPKGLGWTVEDVYTLEARGEWNEALKRWRQLLAPFNDPVIADKIRDTPSHRQLWFHIGLCARHLGDFDEALQTYARSLELARRAGDTRLETELLNSIGVVHRNAGRPAQALVPLREALPIAESLSDPALTATIHDNTALAYLQLGRLDDALTEESTAYEMVRSQELGAHAEVRARIEQNLSAIRAQLDRPR